MTNDKQVNVYVVHGLGIGCQEEVAHAYKRAGATVEIVHINQLLSGEKKLDGAQVLNFPGGFLHGDILGSGMCAANEIETTLLSGTDTAKTFKDALIEYANKGNIIYGQCNGFQVLVKLGLLPGIEGGYSQQTATLAGNDCGVYRVAQVFHKVNPHQKHFAFKGLDTLWLWSRHGEGKIQFTGENGSMAPEAAKENRRKTNEKHVLLHYADPRGEGTPTEEFPYNPNGSVDAIAGLVSANGNIFGHMAHTEVGIYSSRDPTWFKFKDILRRQGIKAASLDEGRLEDLAMQVFRNIVEEAQRRR